MCSVDWVLLLEYIKALAPPLTAGVVAVVGFKSWRKQKALERRLDWHERIHPVLGEVVKGYLLASLAPESQRIKRVDEAIRLSWDLMALTEEAWIYGTQKAFDATRQLREEMTEFHKSLITSGSQVTGDMARQVQATCSRAQEALATEIRGKLGMEVLRQKPVP
jgi:hypothetical protein